MNKTKKFVTVEIDIRFIRFDTCTLSFWQQLLSNDEATKSQLG